MAYPVKPPRRPYLAPSVLRYQSSALGGPAAPHPAFSPKPPPSVFAVPL
jgi:hypothetical protein